MSDPTNSLFEGTNVEGVNPTGSTNNVTSDVTADLLNSIKNERGETKYKDVSSALNGLKNAQEFIPSLQKSLKEKEDEVASLRKQAERVAELERVIESLTTSNSVVPTANKPVDEVDVASLVNKVLSEREQKQVAKTNTDVVVQAVKDAFGAEAEKVFYEKASQLGLSVAAFNALAAQSPKAVLTMLGIAEAPSKQSSFSPTSSSINSSGFVPNKETFITKNKKSINLGATSQDFANEAQAARNMVEELHSQGKTINDLTNPKVFFKHFA